MSLKLKVVVCGRNWENNYTSIHLSAFERSIWEKCCDFLQERVTKVLKDIECEKRTLRDMDKLKTSLSAEVFNTEIVTMLCRVS